MPAICLLLAAAILLATTGCGGDASSADPASKPLKLGYSFGFDAGDVADQVAFRRLEARGGPHAKLVDMGGAANAITALIRDDIDAAVVPYVAAVEAARSGTRIRVVLGANMAPEFFLVARRDIRRPSDLRGKAIAHSGPGTVTGTFAEEVARRAGLGRGDVRFRAIQESSAKTAALLAGRVDAATIDFVDYERIRAEHPDLHVIARLSEVQPRAPTMVWAVSHESAERRPQRVQRLVDGLLDGYELAYTDDGREAWLDEAGATALEGDSSALARRAYDFYRRVGFWPRRTEPVAKAVHERIVRFWLDEKLIERGAPYDEVWDPTFWENAAKG